MKKEPNFEDQKFQSLIHSMRIFAEGYAKSTNTYFCSDEDITHSVIIVLAKNKMETGAALCPCRCYLHKEEEGKLAYWNCPCIPMRERKECHCMLFLTEDNMFASKEQKTEINLDKYKT